MNNDNIVRRAKMELRGKEAELKDVTDRKDILTAAKSLKGGVSPEDDPSISEDWKTFTPEMKEASITISKIINEGGYPTDKIEEILTGALGMSEKMNNWKQAAGRNATDAEVQELVGIMKKDGQQATEKRFKEMYNIKSGDSFTVTPRSTNSPTTMIFKKTLEDFDRMFETKILRSGETYKSLDHVKATPIPAKEARICFLPSPLPRSWNAAFAKDVSEEILLGLPFQTTWIESTGTWEGGATSGIEIDSPDGGKIEIQFCGAFLQTKMEGNTPCLHVKAVMAAGGNKRTGKGFESTVFIANYILTTHLIHWVQERVTRVDWSGVAEEDFKAYPIVGPSVFPIVGFLLALHNKEIRLGSERVNERVRTGTGKNREFHKIKEIVHVSLTRKESELPKIGSFGREIDWSHRFEVSGHWRSIGEGKVGKNPMGEYGVRGFTWVVPHIRGPEDKPLVKKVRVVEQ